MVAGREGGEYQGGMTAWQFQSQGETCEGHRVVRNRHGIHDRACEPAGAQENAALKELAATGKLRLGVVFAPVASAFFVTKDSQGQPHGVTVDLGKELARRLGVPVEFMLAPNSGLVTDATESATIDVAFMPVDEERKKRVDFGPAYYLLESTYLVTGGSGIKALAQVDQPSVRVIGIANTTTIRAATRSLKSTTINAVSSVGDALEMLRTGKADAFALSRELTCPVDWGCAWIPDR